MKTTLKELEKGDAICFKYGFDYHTRKVLGNNGKVICWLCHSTPTYQTYEEMDKQDWSHIGFFKERFLLPDKLVLFTSRQDL